MGDNQGVAMKGLLVRHLVLPGCVENSLRCLRFLAELSPQTFVSIMSQYSPQYKACKHPEINRMLTVEEYDAVTDYILSLDLENALIQGLESPYRYLPDFRRKRPFRKDI